MAYQKYPFQSYLTMPWKNGGGVTREIVKVVDEGGGLLWRLSLATIAASGPFSSFPGLQRIIVALAGDRVTLHGFEGGAVVLLPNEPLSFSGDHAVTATLEGSADDFNVMFDPKAVELSFVVQRLTEGQAPTFPRNADHRILFVSEGALSIGGTALEKYDTLTIEGHLGDVVRATQASIVFLITASRKINITAKVQGLGNGSSND